MMARSLLLAVYAIGALVGEAEGVEESDMAERECTCECECESEVLGESASDDSEVDEAIDGDV